MFSRIAQQCLFVLALSAPLALAQTVANYQDQPDKISIIIDRQAVRFMTSGAALEWRLVVRDQQDEVVFDSGAVNAARLDWPFQNQQGESVPSGLYAYALSTKAAAEEAAHTERGYLIVDRASTSDQVWVTSSREVGIGAEGQGAKLSVSGGEGGSIGGAELPAEADLRARPETRPENKQKEGKAAQGEKTQVAAAAAGTANHLAKFASDGATLVDASVTETPAGDIGIGTAAPGGVFDLQRLNPSGDILQRLWNTTSGTNAAAGAKLRYVAATGATSQLQLTDNAEWLMAIAGNNQTGMQFRVRNASDPNTEAGLNAAARMSIARNGNVGIGTTSPQRLLQLGPSIDALFTFEAMDTSPNAGFIRFGDNTGWRLHLGRSREKSAAAGGTLNTGTTGVLMTIQDNGNVGIGTLNPQARLEVQISDPNAFELTGVQGTGSASRNDFADAGMGVEGIGGASLSSAPQINAGIGVRGLGGGSVNGIGGAGVVGIGGSSGTGQPRGPGGSFDGDLVVTNGTKRFKIDHPLDPENKYLNHAAIESSEVLNVYSGNVVTDQQGEAVVTLPEWFEAVNTDLRYQLTVIGTFAQAIVAKKVKHHRFSIRTSAPNVEVSWQVTGVRSDPAMLKNPFKLEEEKLGRERGSYLSPEAYGQPEEKGVEWVRHPELMRQLKEQREQVHKQAQPAQP